MDTARLKKQVGETMGAMMTLSDKEYNSIRQLVYDKFGINLTEQKRSLIVGRLQKLLREKGFADFHQYYRYVVSDGTGQALLQLVNRISTNHTFFFREKEHFDFLVRVALPQVVEALRKRNSNDLRVWCAGCSSGEEAYALVMLMREFFGRDYESWDAGLLATDISGKVLEEAKAGIYPEDRVKLVPKQMLSKYFRRLPDGNYQAVPELRQEITFRRLNLIQESFPFRKPFDVIFCRNVMIYFDNPTKEALIRRFYQNASPGGYLFIGHSESLGRETCPFDYVMPAVYRKGG